MPLKEMFLVPGENHPTTGTLRETSLTSQCGQNKLSSEFAQLAVCSINRDLPHTILTRYLTYSLSGEGSQWKNP